MSTLAAFLALTALAAPDFRMLLQDGHAAGVDTLAVSKDGRFFASASFDQTIRVFTVADGKLVRLLTGHSASIQTVAFSPDGKFLASGSGNLKQDCTLRIWDLETGTETRRIEFPREELNAITYTPDGRAILVALDAGTIAVVSTADGTITARVAKAHDRALSISVSPDGAHALTGGSEDRLAKLWKLPSLERVLELPKHSGPVRATAFTHDGAHLITGDGGEANCARFFNLEGYPLYEIGPSFSYLFAMALSPDGERIAMGGAGMNVRVYEITSKKKLFELEGHKASIEAIVFTPDNKWILSSQSSALSWTRNADNSIRVWSAADGSLARVHPGLARPIKDLMLAPDGHTAVAASEDGSAKVWDLAEARLVRELRGHDKEVYAAALSHDGSLVATAGGDHRLLVWRLGDGKQLAKIDHPDEVRWARFLPDGERIVTMCQSQVRIIRWKTGEIEKTIEAPGLTYDLPVSRDGKLAIYREYSGYHKGFVLLDLETAQVVRRIPSEFAWHGAFSPDNALISASDANRTHVYRIAELREPPKPAVEETPPEEDTRATRGRSRGARRTGRSRRKGHEIVAPKAELILEGARSPVAFSPDGKLIVTDSATHDLKIWDAKSGKLLRELRGGQGRSFSQLAFDPTGTILAGASWASTICVWNMKSGERVDLVALGDEWVIYAGDGSFDASRDGGKLVAMVSGFEAYGLDQFALQRNRPDKLLERIWGKPTEISEHYRAQYRRRLQRAKLGEDSANTVQPPIARITKSEISGENITIGAELTATLRPLSRYNIYVGDVPLFGAYGKEIKGRKVSIQETFLLGAGRNKIEVSVTDDRGAESLRELTWADGPAQAAGDLYVLAFGVSKYEDPQLQLGYADKDARDLAQALAGLPGFDEVHTRVLTNEEVTPAAIAATRAFLEPARANDVLVLFIAGHGLHDRDPGATYYFLTHGAKLGKLAGTAARFEDIESLLQGIAPRRKLFLMDTCESGEAAGDVAAGGGPGEGFAARGLKTSGASKAAAAKPQRSYLRDLNRYIYNDLIRRSGAIVLSSSRGGELSYEKSDLENGVFTESIITSLSDPAADSDGDGALTSGELRDYVAREVAKLTGDRQHPTIDRDNLAVRFALKQRR